MSSEKEPDLANTGRHDDPADDPAAIESFAKNFSQLVTDTHEMTKSLGKEADFPLDPEKFTEDKIQLNLLKEKAFKKPSK